MGALTVTTVQRGTFGNLRWRSVNIQFSTSYATGGDTGLTAAVLGLDRVLLATFDQPAGYTLHYNYTNGNVFARRSAVHGHVIHFQTGAAANAVTMATNNLRNAGAAQSVATVADATGEGGVVQAAQIALAEPAATTDLSTTVVTTGNTDAGGAAATSVRVLVIGY